MKFSLEMPVRGGAGDGATTIAVAQAAERAGFAMLGYTEHPAPNLEWWNSMAGHATYDPFSALSFVAAVTTDIRLMTHLTVLPYRNPLLTAKSVATVDALSGGRFTLTIGTGYLPSEYEAVGRSFDDRNALYDEAVEVLRNVYRGPFTYHGTDFNALEVVIEPTPVQLPHPPIWIGGNSKASLQRVARFGDGWAPGLSIAGLAKMVRSAPLGTLDDVQRNLDELHRLMEAEGRDPSAIAVELGLYVRFGKAPEAVLEKVATAEKAGITHLVLRPPDGSTQEMTDTIEAFGRDVIPHCS